MAEVKNVNIGVEGMMRDVHSHFLSEKTFTFQKNGNVETDEYGGIALTNEHSNLLCSKLKYEVEDGVANLIVVGNKIDVRSNKIYLFLVVEVKDEEGNLLRQYSEIGELPYFHEVEENEDILEECDCNYKMILATPLEEMENIPEGCKYKTILKDDCNGCLNFDIKYPVKKIEIKDEVSYKRLYFTDGLNPPRYLDLSDIEQYRRKPTGEDCDCDEDCDEPTCLDCDKLRIQKIHKTPVIKPVEVLNGGNLRLGAYSYTIAYCDRAGNELTNHYALTKPIKLFDENNAVMEQKDYARKTNFGIKLEIEDLDSTQFEFYKIVSYEITDVNSNLAVFELGVYPVEQKFVLHETNQIESPQPKRRMIEDSLYNVRPIFETWQGLTSANGSLFGYGYKVQDELNLQPIANLLGSQLKWQTTVAKQDLYKDGVANALYTGYMRDETYAFGIQFLYKTGGRSTVFPLVGRMVKPEEKLSARNLIGYKSFQEYSPECSDTNREYVWQYTNTASIEGECLHYSKEGTPKVRQITAVSKNPEVDVKTNVVYELPISDYEFKGLKAFIDEHYEEILTACSEGDERYSQDFCELITNTYPEIHTAPNLPFPLTEGELEVKTCEIPELLKEEVYISESENETYYLEPKDWKTEYDRTIVNTDCALYTKVEGGDFQGYLEYKDDIFSVNHIRFLDRASTDMGNYSPNDALDLMLPEEFTLNTSFPFSSFFRATPTDNRFFTRYKATMVPPNKVFRQKFRGGSSNEGIVGKMYENIHNMALWYRVSKSELFSAQEGDAPSVIVEITPEQAPKPNPVGRSGTDRGAIEYNPIHEVRLSIFKGKNNYNAVESEVINIEEGWWRMFTEEDFGYEEELYFAIEPYLAVTADPAILELSELIQEDIRILEEKYEAGFTWFPTGCFEVVKRYREYKRAIINIDEIKIGKKETYITNCMYLIPSFNNCEASADKYGEFAYTESSENYPNNEFLWNSSNLKIHSEDVELSEYYYTGIDKDGYYILQNADFRCKPIRHFKFPDNTLVPFIHGEDLGGVGETLIYPLGVTIDPEVVLSFLEVARKNNLITDEQFENIEGFEILRGDRTMHKSILYKGIAHDMYKYKEGKEEWLFRNFPFNSLGENRLLYEDNTQKRFIQHPYGSQRNNKFSIMSPEVYSGSNYTGTEVALEGYQLGYSHGQFNEVEDHPKWVILGKKAENLASTLATLEVAFERAMNIARETIQMGQASSGGFLGTGIGAGTAIGAGGLAAVVLINAFMGTRHRYAELKMKWMDAFKNLGALRNFANYYSAVGDYNFFLPTSNPDNIRALSSYKHLRPGRIITNDITGSDEIKINNLRRESSTLISLGKLQYAYEYDDEYVSWDNVDFDDFTTSRYLASDSSCRNGIEEVGRHIGSPYISVKNYKPNQYGDINNIIWINTNGIFKFNKEYEGCPTIFGGDVVISKIAFKNKFPLFFSDAMKLGDRVGFNYYAYPNVGQPRFYVTYDSIGSEVSGKVEIPFLTSDYNLNCPSDDVRTEKGMYVDPEKKNHKFYLYYYGIAHYFIESEINGNFRVAGVQPHEQFYPYNQDYARMTQQTTVSMDFDNVLYYNMKTYSGIDIISNYLNLKSDFDPELEKRKRDVPNGVVWSRFDNDEMSTYDPWLAFRPLDIYTFPTNYGTLIDMSSIESQQILARFENQAVVFNAVDSLADRIAGNPINEYLGTGGVFATRPLEFSKTDLGETGTQHYSMIQTQFGVFWVDAKRGRVFQIPPGGKQLSEISSFKQQGGPSGMSKWFKKHLPFKILKKVKGLEDKHIDNHFDSLGILMWWDSKFNRVFITKRDFVPLRNDIAFDGDNFIIETTKEIVSHHDKRYFKDVSWTVAYSPLYQCWVSYYDFHPDYALGYNDYFQTGLNFATEREKGIWSHLVTNKSFQVFYGSKYPWTFEVNNKNEYVNKQLNNINAWFSSYRYHNDYDFAEQRKRAVNEMYVYNNTNNSGRLLLNYSDGVNKNPVQVDNLTQKVPATHTDNQVKVNYIYNRVINQDANIPTWNWDENEIDKTLNPLAISFKGKRVLERIKGDKFFTRYSQTESSLFKHMYKWGVTTEEPLL